MRALIGLAALALSAFGAQIDWAGSYAEAMKRASREHKIVLLLITTETCGWCRRMEATTLQNPAVAARINSHFVAVHVTRDKDDYLRTLKAKMVPMSYFLLSGGTVVYRMPGYWNSEDYLSILEDAERKAAEAAAKKEK